jgi:hypothetical protein
VKATTLLENTPLEDATSIERLRYLPSGRDEPGAFASDFGAQVRAYHSIETPLALIGAAHASIWSGSTFAKYRGVLCSGGIAVIPTLPKRSRTVSIVCITASLMRRTISLGVPLGKNSPY